MMVDAGLIHVIDDIDSGFNNQMVCHCLIMRDTRSMVQNGYDL